MMFQTRNDLPEATRTRVVELLNARLVDAVDLYLQLKHAHWNVKGKEFFSLHELFDKVAEGIEEYVDLIAERGVQLGGVALATAGVVAKKTTLPSYPESAVEGADHLAALATALGAFGKTARAAIDQSSELADLDTADLFTEVSRGVDKWLWMVEAHLERARSERR